jgi:predicted nucleic acid-binding protein
MHFPNLTLVDVTRDVARQAAKLRARYHLRPADALHAATALAHNATAFVTNDRDFTQVGDLEIVLLQDFVGGAL